MAVGKVGALAGILECDQEWMDKHTLSIPYGYPMHTVCGTYAPSIPGASGLSKNDNTPAPSTALLPDVLRMSDGQSHRRK